MHLRFPALLLTVVLVGACSLAPSPAPVPPAQDVPEAFEGADASGVLSASASDSLPSLGWWRTFEDPALERLVDTVLAGNLDLAEAVTRVEESRALAGVATADLLPSVTGNADASRSSNPRNAGFGAQLGALLGGLSGDSTGSGEGNGSGGDPGEDEEPSDRFSTVDYSASLGFAYELDFWGRARNDRAATLAEVAASRDDLHAARLGVLSETITAWFQWAELTRRLALSQEIVDVLQERVSLTETRYDRGLVTSFELYQIRQELRNVQSGLPLLRGELADARARLALLAGRYPGEVDPLLPPDPEPVPSTEPLPPAIPADLLAQRPDIRAAARRMEAARLRVGARKAELLPSLNLTGTLGLQSSEPENLFDLSQWFSNLAAGLTAPLFQGGRLRSNLDAAEARWASQVVAYGRTVLTAVGEVETALVQYRRQEERFRFLEAQLEEARASAELQAERYQSGVAPYPDYLDALRNRLSVETTLAQAGRDLALARLAVHRALGGTWTQDSPDGPAWARTFTDAPEPEGPTP